MHTESRPTAAYRYPTEEELLNEQIARIQRLTEPESPVTTLGNIVLSSVIGGALTGNVVFPRTEAVTLELITGATEYADVIQDRRRAA